MNLRRVWPELVYAAIIVGLAGIFFVVQPSIPCLFHAVTGYPCLACGGTRALKLLASGELGAALAMNPLVFLGALGAGVFVVYAAAVLLLRVEPLRPDFRRGWPRAILRYGAISAVAVNWIYLITVGR